MTTRTLELKLEINGEDPYVLNIWQAGLELTTEQNDLVHERLIDDLVGVIEVQTPPDCSSVLVFFPQETPSLMNQGVHAAVIIGEVLGYAPEAIVLDLDYDPEQVPFNVGEFWPQIQQAIEAERSLHQ